jgi:hypothetical protein
MFQPTKTNTDGCPFFKPDSKCPVLVRGSGCPIKEKATETGCPMFGKDATCSYLEVSILIKTFFFVIETPDK